MAIYMGGKEVGTWGGGGGVPGVGCEELTRSSGLGSFNPARMPEQISF